MSPVVVYGLAAAGAATVRALQRRGIDVVAVDDTGSEQRRRLAADLGVELLIAPEPGELDRLIAAAPFVVPAPGVPETHALFEVTARRGVDVVSEIELASRWEREREGGPRPLLAVTGTDGKTTTTLAATAMVEAAGRRAVAAGNTEVPLVAAIDGPADVFVVECTSFRLAWTDRFRADGAAWLNLAPDHLNWHRSMDSYAAAKARIYANQRRGDVAIGNAADPEVLRRLAASSGRRVTFGAGGDYRVHRGELAGPRGAFAAVGDLARSLPHDLDNALAAAALVLETGLATPEAVASALATFQGPPHRIELVGERDGVRFYNDSKATTPHAAAAALNAFERVVLIAGGRNKGLDLAPLADHRDHVRAVVPIGEAAQEIGAAFAGLAVAPADSMADAVARAAELAVAGDAVVLSPGCASFDWYENYEARGDDYRALVAALLDDPDAVPERHRQPERATESAADVTPTGEGNASDEPDAVPERHRQQNGAVT